jgi:hypothetical protein
VIFTICAFLNYWTGLYKEDDALQIKMWARQLMGKTSDLAKEFCGRDGDIQASPQCGLLS